MDFENSLVKSNSCYELQVSFKEELSPCKRAYLRLKC